MIEGQFVDAADGGIEIVTTGYIRSLDGLRGIAILFVLIEHFCPRMFGQGALLPWGRIGVQLFFVLSGFLITRILLEGRLSDGVSDRFRFLRQFYLRRSLRIFPIYYLALTGAIVVGVDAVRDGGLWLYAYPGLFMNHGARTD